MNPMENDDNIDESLSFGAGTRECKRLWQVNWDADGLLF